MKRVKEYVKICFKIYFKIYLRLIYISWVFRSLLILLLLQKSITLINIYSPVYIEFLIIKIFNV